MRFAMYSHTSVWVPEVSRTTVPGDAADAVLQTTRDFYQLTTNQAPFQERSSGAVLRTESRAVYNPNVVYTTRPVFKYTCPPKPKPAARRTPHSNELWRNSAPLAEDTPLESFTVGKYYRNSKVGKSAVAVRDVDGRFIPTPPCTGSSSNITSWSRWFDYF